jgi:hypothetical protein
MLSILLGILAVLSEDVTINTAYIKSLGRRLLEQSFGVKTTQRKRKHLDFESFTYPDSFTIQRFIHELAATHLPEPDVHQSAIPPLTIQEILNSFITFTRDYLNLDLRLIFPARKKHIQLGIYDSTAMLAIIDIETRSYSKSNDPSIAGLAYPMLIPVDTSEPLKIFLLIFCDKKKSLEHFSRCFFHEMGHALNSYLYYVKHKEPLEMARMSLEDTELPAIYLEMLALSLFASHSINEHRMRYLYNLCL